MPHVLIVDDEAHVLRLLSAVLREDGYDVSEAGSIREARAALARRQHDVILTDQRLPDGEGLTLLELSRDQDASIPVIFITAYATLELAVAAMRQGAFDVLAKPFEAGTVRVTVRRACERVELLRENEGLRGAVRRLGASGPLTGDSPPMRRLRERIARVAPTNATVLITGETGTGKELVARAIHDAGPRAARPFIAVNCAAFTESLLESELFGHERGAFTGADRARQGVFEAAHGGTLFLDEAGEMTPPLQAKLLRVLVDGDVVRVGATAARRVDVRILVATHRDLEQRVRDGQFREDLYYRLAVVPLPVPALRERIEDLPALISELVTRVARDLKVPERPVATAALARLRVYDFPGNVRELRNLIERALILAQGAELEPHDLLPGPTALPGGGDPGSWTEWLPGDRPLREVVETAERALLIAALQRAGGVQAEAARRLGISRSDMTYKLRKHGLDERSQP